MVYKNHYQELYEKTDYGQACANKCPGVRYFPQYKHHLLSPVIDLGCGSGDTVKHLHEYGYTADGIDQIDLKNGMQVGNICQPLDLKGKKTAICLDVLEHIPEHDLWGLWQNAAQCERQVFTVHCGPSKSWLTGIELHLTQRPKEDWLEEMMEYFEIENVINLEPMRFMVLSHVKKSD